MRLKARKPILASGLKFHQQIHIALRPEVYAGCRTEEFQAANAIAPAIAWKLSLRQFEILVYHPSLRAAHRATPAIRKGH
jgi:hypothetical protein